MRIRIEPNDGNPDRFKLYDDDTGYRLGLVQSVSLTATMKGATLQFTRIDPETIVLDEKTPTYSGTLLTSPVLKGKLVGTQFVFED